jgi:hypothetical protein
MAPTQTILFIDESASFDELKQLGDAIADLIATGQASEDVNLAQAASAVSDLKGGELPKPFKMRCLSLYRKFKEAFGEEMLPMTSEEIPDELVNKFGIDADARTVVLKISSLDDATQTVTASFLREHLPFGAISRVALTKDVYRFES